MLSLPRLSPRGLRRALASGAAVLLLSCAPSAFALPLSQAVRIAVEQDATIRAMQYNVSRESTRLEIAKDGKRPRISLGGSTNSTTGDAGLTLTISQVLFDWGHVKGLIEAATQERARVVAELKIAVEDLTLQISELYVDFEVLNRKIERTQEYVDFAHRIAQQSRARVDAGLSNSAEIARARLEIARADERMTQLTSDRAITLTQIEFLVGRRIDAPSDANNLAFAERFSNSSAAISAVVLAPQYVIAKAQVDIARAEITTARAATRPKISLQAEARQELTGGRGRSAAIGLSTGVDLSASGLRGRGVTVAEQSLAAAQSRLSAIERELQNNIRTYAQRLRLLRANEASQLEQLKQAREVLNAYEEQFVGGRRELIDLLTTGRDLYEAQIAEIDTFRDRKLTEYEAAHSVGMLGTVLIEKRK